MPSPARPNLRATLLIFLHPPLLHAWCLGPSHLLSPSKLSKGHPLPSLHLVRPTPPSLCGSRPCIQPMTRGPRRPWSPHTPPCVGHQTTAPPCTQLPRQMPSFSSSPWRGSAKAGPSPPVSSASLESAPLSLLSWASVQPPRVQAPPPRWNNGP